MSHLTTKNILIISILLITGCSSKLNQEVANIDGEQILVGKVNWQGLSSDSYAEWFTPNYLNYTVDSVSLNPFKENLDDIEVLVFLGTWCEDSQLEVPQFYKIQDYLGYDISKMKIIALERLESGKLVSPQHEESNYEITHVPTFIFLDKGIEIGRITEYPDKTLEKDMARILGQVK